MQYFLISAELCDEVEVRGVGSGRMTSAGSLYPYKGPWAGVELNTKQVDQLSVHGGLAYVVYARAQDLQVIGRSAG